MKNKGFTLIELLAVIVILAIIALIAIPMISKIIDKTEDSAVLRSAELYIDGVNQSIMRANLKEKIRPKECIIQEDGNLICDGEYEIKIEATGTKPNSGTLIIEDRAVKSFTGMVIDIYELEMDENGKISVFETDEEEIIEDVSNATVILSEKLIPVIYSKKVWKIADTTKPWYNYNNQQWANAVILKNGITKKVGDKIDLSNEVQGMFVYIPRYEYKIEGTYGIHSDGTEGAQNSPGEIKVNFISKDKVTASSGYRIHPAFIFGNIQLSGIWVGKFEPSADTNSQCYTNANEDNCKDIIPYVIPNVSSLRYQTISTQFATAQKFNNFLESGYDAHMAKNSEWASISYLSQSKYGKYGNNNYTSTNKQVMINNCSSYITGIGANNQDDGRSENTCITNTYETLKGQAASTTGNIYGIYDMSGGAYENVMGVLNKTLLNSGFSTLPNEKYYDNYTGTTVLTACNNGECYGHALSETLGWYSDESNQRYFINSSNPWFDRGGYTNEGSSTGVFSFNKYDGNSEDIGSFRIIITNN